VGDSEGCEVDTTTGDKLGRGVNLYTGIFDGVLDGFELGCEVGELRVGNPVGSELGRLLQNTHICVCV